MLLVGGGGQKENPACKKTEWWGAGIVICLERDADLHTAQLMPMPLTVSCFSKIQIGFTFLVPAHSGSPGQRAIIRVCECVCIVVLTWFGHAGDDAGGAGRCAVLSAGRQRATAGRLGVWAGARRHVTGTGASVQRRSAVQ